MKGVNLRPRADSELAEFWWVAPHRVMYTVGESTGELEAPVSTGELYAVNADGTGAALIFGSRMGGQGATHIQHGTQKIAYGELIDELPADPKGALIASYPVNGANLGYTRSSPNGVFPEALHIDIFNGATMTVTVSPLRNAQFLTDNDRVVRFAYGNDVDQAMKVWYRAGDGKNWELRQANVSPCLRSVCFGKGCFLAVGGRSVMTSSDGVTWVPRPCPGRHYFEAVAFGGETFVAVGWRGADFAIFSSQEGMIWQANTSTDTMATGRRGP